MLANISTTMNSHKRPIIKHPAAVAYAHIFLGYDAIYPFSLCFYKQLACRRLMAEYVDWGNENVVFPLEYKRIFGDLWIFSYLLLIIFGLAFIGDDSTY